MRTMILREKILYLAVFLMFASGFFEHTAAADADPLDAVKSTVNEVLVILKDPVLRRPENSAKRQRLIKETVDRRFDYREMSKQTLANHWNERTQDEQDKFVELFSRLLEKTYISKIDSYSDEEILFKEKLVKGDKAMVRSYIVKNNKEIPMIYKLKNTDGNWMVYGVVIEGVSLIRNYRTQFESIIDKEKYPGLIKRIEEKIEKPEPS